MTDVLKVGTLLGVIGNHTTVSIECENNVLWRGINKEVPQRVKHFIVEKVWIWDDTTLVIEVIN